ncbi:MAG: hypothetical protein GY924_14220 [Planctomycetaceae bacterium]|nr:hypothetical protein [Planctomycetaceae bacterium]
MSLLPRRLIAIFIVTTMTCAVMSQPPGNRRNAKPPAPPKKPALPNDPQLLGLHKEFVLKAEKLAVEYERKKQFDKAREVYESMVRLVPNFASAEAGLQRILGNQRIQDRKLVTVEANQMWQDSGVNLQVDMPVHTEVKGSWKVVYETGPKGIEIPKEFQQRDGRIKLGSLIGVVVTSPTELKDAKPFPVEHGKNFTANKTGRLFLRMFDVDHTDNEGKMLVLIQSTFAN